MVQTPMTKSDDKIRAIKEKASKFAQKGQIKKAIREYEQLLEMQPDDVRTLQRLGELWARGKNPDLSIKHYLKAADGHSRAGFADRAVAVLKQALAVDATRLDLNLRLAAEYMTKGLEREATSHLVRAAGVYAVENRQADELEVLKQATKLVPGDVDAHMNLARLYVRMENLEKARDEFMRAALELQGAGKTEEFIAVAEKVLQIGEAGVELHLSLAQCYIDTQKWDKVQPVLVHPINVQSDDYRTLELSAQGFIGMDQPEKAIAVYKRMARTSRLKGNDWAAKEAQEKLDELNAKFAPPPVPEPPPIPTARTHEIADMREDEVEMVTEEMDEPDENTMVAAIEDILSEMGTAGPELEEDLAEGLQEADFLIGQGLLEEAQEALEGLAESYPDHPEINRRIEEIGLLADF